MTVRGPGSVVSAAGDLFATAWRVPGVLRFSNGRWSNELPGACDGGALAVAGDRVVLVTSGSVEQPPPEKRLQISRQARILAYVRSSGGEWSSPIDLAGGEATLQEYRQMPAVILPTYGPADCIPVAWSDSKRVWLKRVNLPSNHRCDAKG